MYQSNIASLKQKIEKLKTEICNATSVEQKSLLLENLIEVKDKLAEEKDKLAEAQIRQLAEEKDKLAEEKDKLAEEKDKLAEEKDKQANQAKAKLEEQIQQLKKKKQIAYQYCNRIVTSFSNISAATTMDEEQLQKTLNQFDVKLFDGIPLAEHWKNKAKSNFDVPVVAICDKANKFAENICRSKEDLIRWISSKIQTNNLDANKLKAAAVNFCVKVDKVYEQTDSAKYKEGLIAAMAEFATILGTNFPKLEKEKTIHPKVNGNKKSKGYKIDICDEEQPSKLVMELKSTKTAGDECSQAVLYYACAVADARNSNESQLQAKELYIPCYNGILLALRNFELRVGVAVTVPVESNKDEGNDSNSLKEKGEEKEPYFKDDHYIQWLKTINCRQTFDCVATDDVLGLIFGMVEFYEPEPPLDQTVPPSTIQKNILKYKPVVPNKRVYGNNGTVTKIAWTYSKEAHEEAVKLNLAPKCTVSKRFNHYLVEIDTIHFPASEVRINISEWDEFKFNLQQFHKKYVHGDLRLPNILYGHTAFDDKDKFWLIDFDWAGNVNDARYPVALNSNITWPQGAGWNAKITVEHDKFMLDQISSEITELWDSGQLSVGALYPFE